MDFHWIENYLSYINILFVTYFNLYLRNIKNLLLQSKEIQSDEVK